MTEIMGIFNLLLENPRWEVLIAFGLILLLPAVMLGCICAGDRWRVHHHRIS